MTLVTAEKLEAELDIARFEVERLVEAGVLSAELDGSFDLGWCRLALRAYRLREPTIIGMLSHEAADLTDRWWSRLEIYRRSVLAGPEARTILIGLGRDALRHLRLMAAIRTGEDRDRSLLMAEEIEGALDRLSRPRAAE